MNFFKITRKIRTEEDGAVTVDWVVLTAAIVALGALAMTAISSGTKGLSEKIGSYLENDVTVGSTTAPADSDEN